MLCLEILQATMLCHPKENRIDSITSAILGKLYYIQYVDVGFLLAQASRPHKSTITSHQYREYQIQFATETDKARHCL